MVVTEDFVSDVLSGSKIPKFLHWPRRHRFLRNVGESYSTRQNHMNWGNWKDPHITLHHGLSGFSVHVLLHFPVFIYGLQLDEGFGSSDVEICAVCDITQHRVVIPYRRFGTTYPHPIRVSQWVVPKRRYGITTLRHVISKKNAAHIHIAAEAWNHDFVVIVQWIKQKWGKATNSYESLRMWHYPEEIYNSWCWRCFKCNVYVLAFKTSAIVTSFVWLNN